MLVLEDVGLLTRETAVVHHLTSASGAQHTRYKVGDGRVVAAICSVIIRRDIFLL